jgi:predicted permease
VSILKRLRNVFRADRVSDEIDREMEFHIGERTDELIASGVPEDAARREARRRFGSVALATETTRERDLFVWLETFLSDLRYGLRALGRDPVFCATAILTLAIGIGANTAVFSLLHGLLLRSLPVSAPQDLVRVDLVSLTDPRASEGMPYGMQQQLRRQQRSFVDLSSWQRTTFHVADQDGTLRQQQAALVSGDAFETIGLRPRLGRLLTPSDDVRGGPPEGWPVVISDSFWRERYNADPRAIGSTLKVADGVLIVVGIAPAAFHGAWPGFEPKLYVPLRYQAVRNVDLNLDDPRVPFGFSVIGRLKRGVSAAEATAELAVYHQPLMREYAVPDPRWQEVFKASTFRITSARTGLPSFFGRQYSAPLYLMQGLVGIVLLLCCVNVSGLMLSKLHERQHEFAVRTAIGAGRTRLTRQYLTESFVIAAVGAGLGAAGAWYGSPWLGQFFRHPMMVDALDVRPDRTVFLVTAGLAVLTTLFFGILPAWKAGRTSPGTVLKSRIAAQRQLAGRGLVALQVALSLVLVVLATLLSTSLMRLTGEPTGFSLDRVTIQTAPLHKREERGDAKIDLYQRMVERLNRSPGMTSAAVTWYTPMTSVQATARFQALAAGASAPEDVTLAFNSVGPGYFRTMQTAILSGREFEPRERTRDVCVVNESAAALLFPNQPAIGRYVQSGDELGLVRGIRPRASTPTTCRIVGIAADAKFASAREAPPRTIYFPITPDIVNTELVFLLNAPTKAVAVQGYREMLREISPATPLVLFVTLREQLNAMLGSQRAITMLSTCFGVVALLLSAIGLYGMLSANVSQRTGEIGIRVALGATRGTILKMVFSDAFRLVAIGAALGAVGLFFTTGAIEHMLYGVSAFDPATIATACALLALVVIVASFTPARRAASIDPIQAMRSE